MGWLAAIGGGASLLLQIVVGVRLLRLAARTRELPEAVLGFALFAMGGVATPAAALARAPLELTPDTRALMLFAYCLIMALGTAGITAFTQRVFRGAERWAQALAALLPGLMFTSLVYIAFGPGFDRELAVPGAASVAGNVCLLLALAWAAAESLRHAALLKRRVALGLADPVVVNRVRLWGVAMLISSLMCAAGTATQWAGIAILNTQGGAAALSGLGLVSGSALYLAFFPPPAYRRFVARRFAR